MKVITVLARTLLLIGLITLLVSCKSRLSPGLFQPSPYTVPTPIPVTIHNPPAPPPTPTASLQRGAAWVSNTTPPAGSSITVFAKFTRGDAQPVAGVRTAILILYPGQPVRLPPGNGWELTNRDGVATFTINTGDNPDGVIINVTFIYHNHIYKATTFFATM
jgi:hypothetical protein